MRETDLQMGHCFQYFPQLHNSLNQNHVAPLTTLWSLMVDKASPFSSSLTCRTLPENSLEADPLGIRDFKELVKIFPTHFRLFAFSVVFWRTCFYASLQKKKNATAPLGKHLVKIFLDATGVFWVAFTQEVFCKLLPIFVDSAQFSVATTLL